MSSFIIKLVWVHFLNDNYVFYGKDKLRADKNSLDFGLIKNEVDKLIKDYNESLKKKEKHKQLVYVLDQIKNKK